MRRSIRLASLALAAAAVVVAYAAGRQSSHDSVAQPRPNEPAAPAHAASAPAAPPAAPAVGIVRGPLRFVAIGGGSFPASSEVSLEHNLTLAHDVLLGPGALLFAGGVQSLSVRVLDERTSDDDLLLRLGDLFQPNIARHSRYRHPAVDAQAATLDAVQAQLTAALSEGDEPLIVYVATHGDQGERAADNRILLWGGAGITVAQLADLHARHPRPLRLIASSCFSGGFADLAFDHADPKAGPAREPRCGLFAGTWDRETSGCDPDPNRSAQQGYGLHLLLALQGRDREGNALPLRDLDSDGDGLISLLEAHAWTSAADQSIDVPTTTSERYLREVQTRQAPANAQLLPEVAAVVARLGNRLGANSAGEALGAWQALDTRLAELEDHMDQAERDLDERYGDVAARLLARWPVLDDPYHPDFASTLARDRAAIGKALRDWPEAGAYDASEAALERLLAEHDALAAQEAIALRLVRAHETLGLAAGLHSRGGPAWAHYARLLECERYVPRLRPIEDP